MGRPRFLIGRAEGDSTRGGGTMGSMAIATVLRADFLPFGADVGIFDVLGRFLGRSSPLASSSSSSPLSTSSAPSASIASSWEYLAFHWRPHSSSRAGPPMSEETRLLIPSSSCESFDSRFLSTLRKAGQYIQGSVQCFTNVIYSRALERMVALLILRAHFTPSMQLFSSITSGTPLDGLKALSRKRTAGMALRSPMMHVLRFVRYRRSMVVCAVLGRPEGPTCWGAGLG